MSAIPLVLLGLATVLAVSLIIGSVKKALPGIRQIQQQLRDGSTDFVVTTSTVNLRLPVAAPVDSARLPRLHRRGARPKPVTHRLHHFPRPASSAA